MDWARTTDAVPWRVVGPIAGVTVLLTAGMIGIRSLLTGDAAGASGRIHYYVLLTAIAFVATLWQLDAAEIDGITVLIASSGIAIGSGVLVSLAIEGVIFVIDTPGWIVSSQMLFYFLAAGLICTGLGMWCLRHWREFTAYESIDDESIEDESTG